MLGRAHWAVSLDGYHLSGNPDDIDFYYEFDLDDLRRASTGRPEELLTVAARAKSAGLLHALGIKRAGPMLVLQFRAGASTRNLFVDEAHVKEVLAGSFEDFEYLNSYNGIWSAQQGSIETLVEYASLGGMLAHYPSGPDSPRSLEIRGDRGVAVRVGFPSADAIALLSTDLGVNRLRKLTLSIDGLELDTHDATEVALEAIGNSFLIQVEQVVRDLPRLVTRRRQDDWRLRDESALVDRIDESALTYPSPHLRREPAKMYLYARRISTDLPVVRFLAFYQVIEYFFPIYARMRIVDQLQAVLQSPGFDVNSPSDVGKLITAFPSGGRGGLGNELDQLQAALRKCLDVDAIRTLLADARRDHSVVSALTSNEQPLG